jgi:3-dehydroquinate synthase
MRSLNINSKLNNYEVTICSIENIVDSIRDHTVVIDSKVHNLYKDYFKNVDTISYVCEEQEKTLYGVTKLVSSFISKGLKSNAKIAVVGGGILQDVAGFACSIFCRGVEYTLVPTTLLSQADSCIGGKTSINFSSVKNILGTFYPPKKILISTEFINTLTIKDYYSGMGEIVKFNILKDTLDNLTLYSVEDLVYDSLNYKARIIEIDEFDKADRKFLNFGHTFGHALESSSSYKIPHGSAVLLGILIANNVSKSLGLLSAEKESLVSNLIFDYIKNIDYIDQDWFDFDKLLSIIKHDKKNTGIINMVLITEEKSIIKPIEDIQILKNAVKNIYETIRLRNTIS